jgi:HTH-type transcriptional regulator / antitoxin HipB
MCRRVLWIQFRAASDSAHKVAVYAKEHIDALSDLPHNTHMVDLARNPKQIGILIHRARKKRAWTQKQLGAKAGLRQATVSLIETGNPATRIDTLLALLAALDLELRIAPRSKGWGKIIEESF